MEMTEACVLVHTLCLLFVHHFCWASSFKERFILFFFRFLGVIQVRLIMRWALKMSLGGKTYSFALRGGRGPGEAAGADGVGLVQPCLGVCKAARRQRCIAGC